MLEEKAIKKIYTLVTWSNEKNIYASRKSYYSVQLIQQNFINNSEQLKEKDKLGWNDNQPWDSEGQGMTARERSHW